MEAAAREEPAGPGLPSSPGHPIRAGNMEGSADVLPDTFAAAASSHEDEDCKESDRWRLHSDASTISSRAVEHLFPAGFPMLSLPCPFCLPRFLLGEGRSGVEEEDVAEGGGQVASYQGARARLPDTIHRARQTHLDMAHYGLRCPVPAWPRHRHRFHGRSGRTRATMALELDVVAPGYDETWSSTSSSSEDPIAYRNARQFPPQLPAGPAHGPSAPRSRSSAANQITAWVSQYEKSRSPTRSRSRLGDISAVIHPTDTESHSDGSLHSDDSSHGEIEMLWQQLKEKRTKLSGTRAEMRSRRKELREKRREKDAADNAFMSVVRPVLVSQGELFQSPTSLIESRLERMQQLRDDYQVLESSYESLEAMLDGEERDLSILETRFFSILAAGQTQEERQLDVSSDSGTANFSVDQSEVPYELRGISPHGPAEEPHPLYVDLTSAVGYLGNARDEYADLLSTKEQYEEEQQLKRTTRRKISDELDMKEFFDEFPLEERRMSDAVANLESKVHRLRKLCEDRGVMKKHMSVKMEYALDPQIEYEDLDLDDEQTIMSRRKTLAHPEFNELLSQPDHVLAEEPLTPLGALKAAIRLPNHHPEKGVRKRLASKEYAIDNLMRECDGGKKADYVNRWLLHQLRLSPLNAVLLRSAFQASRSLKIRDMWRWQCDVMHYWWRDNTMSLTDGFFKPFTSDNSEYSSRLGTPQPSRAASDGGPRQVYQQHQPVDNSDAMTEYG
ncbi:hypothetical protein Trco_008082 [Trichoderma cornu-damae]|uniref:Uncharacterized protein n=1 Tax=Trichoderma cornu-damae TaxID=654480 RepID=A0A9P8TSU2_9HYPO|nr:hypothetical protein Trco_008082 [Trichoderma cornu-damae]